MQHQVKAEGHNPAGRSISGRLPRTRASADTAGADVFSALANPVRRAILMRLRDGPRAVSDLAHGFEIGRPAVSEHLQVLRKAKLVREEPRGRERYYHLDPRPLAGVEAWIGAFTSYWEQRLAALEKLLDEEAKE